MLFVLANLHVFCSQAPISEDVVTQTELISFFRVPGAGVSLGLGVSDHKPNSLIRDNLCAAPRDAAGDR